VRAAPADTFEDRRHLTSRPDFRHVRVTTDTTTSRFNTNAKEITVKDPHERQPRVVAYTRVSTREQADSGLGLAAQREKLTDETVRREWPDVLWVMDDGVSATTAAAARPRLGPVLMDMRDGDVLVVTRLDRLSRSVHDFAGLLSVSMGRGWSIVALDLGIDTTTPTGALIAHMVVAIAQWEASMIALRTKEGLAQSPKRLGRAKGSPKTGGRKQSPIPATTEAQVRHLTGLRMSPREIADALNEFGVPSLRGARWHRESVRRLIDRLAAMDAPAGDTIVGEEAPA
jgi:DNA invertase Pin-like site-specific DNA recombinase